MAAVTVASGYPVRFVAGSKVIVLAKLTAPADGDTWATGLTVVDAVFPAFISGTIAAADAIGVNSISGGTVTLEVVGTARDIFVMAVGH